MYRVWPAIEAKFNGSKALKAVARRIYLGVDDRAKTPLPYIAVTCTAQSTEPLYAVSLETYALTFIFFSKHERPDACLDMMREFRKVFFDHCSWPTGEFVPSGFVRVSSNGPVHRDGVFESSMDYELTCIPVQGDPPAGSVAHGAGVQYSGAS